jgi:hypothetical protein
LIKKEVINKLASTLKKKKETSTSIFLISQNIRYILKNTVSLAPQILISNLHIFTIYIIRIWNFHNFAFKICKHFLCVFSFVARVKTFLTHTMIQNLILTVIESMVHYKYINFNTLQIKIPNVIFDNTFTYVNFVMLYSCLVSNWQWTYRRLHHD